MKPSGPLFFPGLRLQVLSDKDAEELGCEFCGRDDVPLMASDDGTANKPGVCEVCALILAHAWRLWQGDVDQEAPAFSPRPGFVLGLVLRERPGDLRVPFEALMVERKDEPGVFGLPGGKVEPDETPEEALVRELRQESFVETWPSALEPLYSGFSPRARWGKVYIVRGYAVAQGADENATKNDEHMEIGWKPWPLSQHARHLGALYLGIQEALALRWKLHTKLGLTTPLSVLLGDPATAYVSTKLIALGLYPEPFGMGHVKSRPRMLEGYWHVMTPEEQEICDYITEMHIKQRDERAIARLDKQAVLGVTTGLSRHPKVTLPMGVAPDESAGVEEDEPQPEGEDEAGPEAGEESTRPGFARPAGGIKPPRRDE